MVEFSLVFVFFLILMLVFAQASLYIWTKATLNFAVRQAVRYGVTGLVSDGRGHDESIRAAAARNAVGLANAQALDSRVEIEYFDPRGMPTDRNDGRNTMVVSVKEYPVPVFVPGLFGKLSTLPVSVSAVGRMQALRTAPPG